MDYIVLMLLTVFSIIKLAEIFILQERLNTKKASNLTNTRKKLKSSMKWWYISIIVKVVLEVVWNKWADNPLMCVSDTGLCAISTIIFVTLITNKRR